MTEQAKAVKDEKVTRRNSKGALTRLSNTLNMLCSENRNVSDIEEVLLKFKSQFDIVTQKHEELIALICDDEQYEIEEQWMTHCLEEFLKQEFQTQDYLKKMKDSEQVTADHENDHSTEQNLSFVESNPAHAEPDTGQNHVHGGDSHELPAANQNENILINVNENANTISALNAISECSFKVEKPKLPKFSGNIMEYAMFKSDFKHIVHSKYSKRDAITLLRTCLVGKPLQLIQGLGNDLEAAWAYFGFDLW